MTEFRIHFKSPGPVNAAFMASDDPFRLIMGPYGSGKTSGALLDGVFRAPGMDPSPVDGVRYYATLTVRDTYRNLEATTLKTWLSWVPKDIGEFNGEPPITHRIRFAIGVGEFIDYQQIFIALGDNRVEDVTRGLEVTDAFIDEADRVDENVQTYVYGRTGRYPSKQHGGQRLVKRVKAAMNAPDTENWTYDAYVENPRPGYAFFRQPSGLSPKAENLANLPDGYYESLSVGQPDWWVRRFVRNEFGYSRDGKPVYPEYSDLVHCAADDLKPIPGLPLIVGLDAGMMPAAELLQWAPNGQKRVIDELVGAHMGPNRFGELLNQLLTQRYAGFKIVGIADPSAAYGADKQDAEDQTWIDIVAAKTFIPILPAPTNKLSARLDAVRLPLTRMIDGDTPALLISPRCRVLRKGFNSGYQFRRIQVAGSAQFTVEPTKNEFSHPQDALQYACLHAGEYAEVMNRKAGQYDVRRQVEAITDINPDGAWEDGGAGSLISGVAIT